MCTPINICYGVGLLKVHSCLCLSGSVLDMGIICAFDFKSTYAYILDDTLYPTGHILMVYFARKFTPLYKCFRTSQR